MKELTEIIRKYTDGVIINEAKLDVDEIIDDGKVFGIRFYSNQDVIFIELNKESFLDAVFPYLDKEFGEKDADEDCDECDQRDECYDDICDDCKAELEENDKIDECCDGYCDNCNDLDCFAKHNDTVPDKVKQFDPKVAQDRFNRLDKLFDGSGLNVNYLYDKEQNVEYKGETYSVTADHSIVCTSKSIVLEQLKTLLDEDYETVFPFDYNENVYDDHILEYELIYAYIPKKKDK
jgi:hypothetical protein